MNMKKKTENMDRKKQTIIKYNNASKNTIDEMKKDVKRMKKIKNSKIRK